MNEVNDVMLKEDADKEYLVGKVLHYTKQGDLEMANRFIDAYIGRVDTTKAEIDMLVKKALNEVKKQGKKNKGDE